MDEWCISLMCDVMMIISLYLDEWPRFNHDAETHCCRLLLLLLLLLPLSCLSLVRRPNRGPIPPSPVSSSTTCVRHGMRCLCKTWSLVNVAIILTQANMAKLTMQGLLPYTSRCWEFCIHIKILSDLHIIDSLGPLKFNH